MRKRVLAWSPIIIVPLAVLIFKGLSDGESSSSSERVGGGQGSTWSEGELSEGLVRSSRSAQLAQELPADEDSEVPGDAGPSVADQIAVARNSPFNFVCACCGDHQQYLDSLAKAGLTWPKIWDGLEDEVAFHNLKMREEQAILMSLNEPKRAVDFMTAQIENERQKLAMRDSRAEWDVSRQENPAGDSEALSKMLATVEPRYFEPMALEVLRTIDELPQGHVSALIKQSYERSEEVRLRVFGALADAELLQSSADGQKAYDELKGFLGGKSFPDSYHSSVTDIYDQNVSALRESALDPIGE